MDKQAVLRAASLTTLMAGLFNACGGTEHGDKQAGGASSSANGGSVDHAGAAGAAGAGGAGGVEVEVESRGVRVFSGPASMLYDGEACTGELGAGGDRWCGFVGLTEAGSRGLFVVNVSQALAGVPVVCGAPDPNCLLLTESLGGDSFDPTWHGTFFQGDTLVYYDTTFTPFAWRPGMPAGRLLMNVSPELDAIFCRPASRGTAIACLGYPSPQADESIARATLFAGRVDAAEEPLLAPIDEVIAGNASDQPGVGRFGFGFPPLPGSIAWSTRREPDGPEVLSLQQVDDASTRTEVASDVHDWDVSSDASRWFWLRGIDPAGVGMLQTAAFPGGENPTDVQAEVMSYGISPTVGTAVATLTLARDLSAIADPVTAPDARVLLDTRVQALLTFSGKGHVAYAKHLVGNRLVDLFVANADGSGTCAVDTTTGVPRNSIHFSPNAEALVWALARAGSFEGIHTALADCKSSTLAPNVAALGWIGPVILFMDEFNAEEGTASLRLRALADERLPQENSGVLVARSVDSYTVTRAAPAAVIYTLSGSALLNGDGVYVRALDP